MELHERSLEELQGLAEKYKLGKQKRTKAQLIEDIEKAAVKHKLKLEAKARAELAVEAEAKLKQMGFDPKKRKLRPSPETKAIEASTKKYYLFHNNEEEGQRVAFRPGEKYRFELFDGKIHILPEWLVRVYIRNEVKYPVYEQRKNRITGLEESVHVGNRPRWAFDELEDAPKDAEFGVVIDSKLEAKYLQPV